MSQTTAIEWTDVSWNPVHGCSKVSPGCAHCYAETLSLRYGHTERPWTPANGVMNVLIKPHKLREPVSNAKAWRGLGSAAAAAGKTDGKLVFVNSMSDLFHEEVPDDFIADVFSVMARCPQHTFQVLTKRPERMHDLMLEPPFEADLPTWPLANVWLGVSIENRRFVGRADVLRDTPAAARFISAEPLLGPLVYDYPEPGGRTMGLPGNFGWHDQTYVGPELSLRDIDWLIVGGESGPGHRPLNIGWARDLRDECMAATTFDGERHHHTAFFVKQLGGARPGTKLEDLPADLRIREFPSRVAA